MKNKIDNYIGALQQAVGVAGLNYEVWWTFKQGLSRKKYVDTMNNYTMYFQSAIHAHFVAMLISLYRLYENKKDTINIPQLRRLIQKHDPFSPQTEAQITALYDEAILLWKKVAILRNAAFGHQTNKLSVSDVFKKANVTPNELHDLWEITKKLINKTTRAWNRSSHAFNLGAREDTERLLSDLNKLHEKG
jgi:hypothetical protein